MTVPCPFCHATHTTIMARFGSRLLTEQWWCEDCHSAFEWVPQPSRESHHD